MTHELVLGSSSKSLNRLQKAMDKWLATYGLWPMLFKNDLKVRLGWTRLVPGWVNT